MAKRTAKQSTGQLKLLPSREQIEEQIREELRTRMSASMLEVVYAIFEEQKELLCGKPWTRKEPGQGRRGGTEQGSVYLEGQRVSVTYPRVVSGRESRAVDAYQALRSHDLLDPEVQTKLIRGVSTRDYSQVITKLAEGTGLGKDTVSRAFIRASKQSLEEINGRDLSKHQFVAIFIDGIGFGKETTLVIAMGVTREGEKVLLGLQEGHTENSTVVGTLLDNLVDRKLALADRFLAVLDGAKALKAAILARWRGRVVIQRCQIHKKRNVCEHLTPHHAHELKRRMNVAYGMRSYEEAKKVMENTLLWLDQISEPAAASLKEGLEETLTVVKLGLPDLLRRTFSTTNPIESILDGVRYRTHRVKRWRSKGQMVARWASSALLVVEKRLHRVKGASLLSSLVQALEKVDELMKVG
jgi:putative transposase